MGIKALTSRSLIPNLESLILISKPRVHIEMASIRDFKEEVGKFGWIFGIRRKRGFGWCVYSSFWWSPPPEAISGTVANGGV